MFHDREIGSFTRSWVDKSVKGNALIKSGPHRAGLHKKLLVGEHFSYLEIDRFYRLI